MKTIRGTKSNKEKPNIKRKKISRKKMEKKKKSDPATNEEKNEGKIILQKLIKKKRAKKKKDFIKIEKKNQNEKDEKENTSTDKKKSKEEKFYSLDDISSFNLNNNNDFQFLNDNKNIWYNYLKIDEDYKKDQFESIYTRILEIALQKKNNVSLLCEIISKIGFFIESKEIKDNSGKIDSTEVVADKWSLNQFEGYYEDVFKRKSNISNYKNRNTSTIEKLYETKWRDILDFLGFHKQLKFEDIWDYWWYVWYLPNKLLIIWLAKLDSITFENSWWIQLINEWKQYWYEILRSKGIKNWLITFVNDK